MFFCIIKKKLLQWFASFRLGSFTPFKGIAERLLQETRRTRIDTNCSHSRLKALLMEPSALRCAVRHDDIETIYKKLRERRDTADVTEVLKELQAIVSAAIRAQAPGDDQSLRR
jgi:hypothetical protein